MAYKKTKNRLKEAFKDEDKDIEIDEGVLVYDEGTAKKDGCNCKDKKKKKKSSHKNKTKGKHKK